MAKILYRASNIDCAHNQQKHNLSTVFAWGSREKRVKNNERESEREGTNDEEKKWLIPE